MDITIIGTGNMARAIATVALSGGNSVTVIGKEPGEAEKLAGELAGDVGVGLFGDEISSNVVVLAVWLQAFDGVIERYADQLAGKIVIEIGNPLDPETYEFITLEAGSSAQDLANRVPGARVAKAFNTTFAPTLVAGKVSDEPLDVFVAADDDDAKAAVRQLAEGAGLRVLDVGPLANAGHLESLGYMHIAVQGAFGNGYNTALRIVG